MRVQELEGTLERRNEADLEAEKDTKRQAAEESAARARDHQKEIEEQLERERKETDEAKQIAAHKRSASLPSKLRSSTMPQELPEPLVWYSPPPPGASSFNKEYLHEEKLAIPSYLRFRKTLLMQS